jgi:hypothetical protein
MLKEEEEEEEEEENKVADSVVGSVGHFDRLRALLAGRIAHATSEFGGFSALGSRRRVSGGLLMGRVFNAGAG